MIAEELQEISTLAREFAATELRPNVERWDHQRSLDAATLSQVAELGFFGMLVPDADGGMGMDTSAYVTALEQLAWGEAGVALLVANSSFVSQVLSRSGTSAQKSEWLERLATGALLGCQAVAQDQGADAAHASAQAVKNGSGWQVSGGEHWVTSAGGAHVTLVSARTDGGVSLFLVPSSAAGYDAGERAATMGLRTVDVRPVRFTGMQLGQDARLSGEALDECIATARLGIAAISVGIAQAALDHALAYADEREQFGQKLREFEAVQFKLADMSMRTEAARALLREAAAAPGGRAASSAKILASETAMWVTTEAVQVYGGYGYMRDYPVEKLMRDAKAMELVAGANDGHRVLIAADLYQQ